MLTLAKPRPFGPRASEKGALSAMIYFKKVSPIGLLQIRDQMIEKKYAKRESIFLEDDLADRVWFVKEGHVKEVHHLLNGRNRTISMVGPNGLFGISAFVGGDYGFHCIAETEATVLSIPVHSLQVLMEKWPDLARAILFNLSQTLRKSKKELSLCQENAEKRLLHVLVELVEEYGNTIPLTRKEISEMAGVAVETCIRIFSRMEGEGWMMSAHGTIMIKGLNELKDRIGDF
jgi:CRP-like cAMP-binding protein